MYLVFQLEEQKLCKAAKAAEEAAHRRIEKTIDDQAKMLRGLADTQNRLEAQASTIEMCSSDVDKVESVFHTGLKKF